MNNLAKTLLYLYPDGGWNLTGSDLSGLMWMREDAPPTQQQVDAAMPQALFEAERQSVQMLRQARYRSEADPLFFEAQRAEDGVTMADWEAKVAQIKAELPYPPVP